MHINIGGNREQRMADDFAKREMQLTKALARKDALLRECLSALREARHHVYTQNAAEGMWEGFGGRKPRDSDHTLHFVDDMVSKIEKELLNGQ